MFNKRGQALVEYILIISLIVIVIFGIMTLISGYLHDAMTRTTCEMMNKNYVEGEKPGDGDCVNFNDTEEDDDEEDDEEEQEAED